MTTKATRDVVDLSTRPITKFVLNNNNDSTGPRSIDDTTIGVTTPNVGFFTNLQGSNLRVTTTANFTGATIIGLGAQDGIPTVNLNSAYTVLNSDFGKLFVCNGNFTLSLDKAANLGAGWKCYVKNVSVGQVILDPNGTELIDGALTVILNTNQSIQIVCTGTTFYTLFQSAGGSDPSGTVKSYAGLALPAGFLWCDGRAYNRVTYPDLFSALSISATGDLTANSTTIANLSTTTGMQVGMPISGAGISTGTVITAITSSTSITISIAAASNLTSTALVVCPFGVGDGTTTFNVPDLRGRAAIGRDDMNGTPANRVTSSGSGISGITLGGNGGAETVALTVGQMPSHGHPWQTSTATQTTAQSNASGGFMMNGTLSLTTEPAYAGTPSNTLGQQIGGTGGGQAHQNMIPVVVLNYIIKY